MQRCDTPIRAPPRGRRAGLNPTYPGCSAVIGRDRLRLAITSPSRLNPTYPGCSAVIYLVTTYLRIARVLILLTLDAAL